MPEVGTDRQADSGGGMGCRICDDVRRREAEPRSSSPEGLCGVCGGKEEGGWWGSGRERDGGRMGD